MKSRNLPDEVHKSSARRFGTRAAPGQRLFGEGLAIGGAQPAEQRAVLSELTGERFGQRAVLGCQEMRHRSGEVALVPQEAIEARDDLAIARIEVARQHLHERRLLALDVGGELLVQVFLERLADVL